MRPIEHGVADCTATQLVNALACVQIACVHSVPRALLVHALPQHTGACDASLATQNAPTTHSKSLPTAEHAPPTATRAWHTRPPFWSLTHTSLAAQPYASPAVASAHALPSLTQ